MHGYDYASPGWYFITICTHERKHLFGIIVNGCVHLNPLGKTAKNELLKTSSIRRNTRIDSWVIMPDHVHYILEIRRGDACVAPDTCVAPEVMHVAPDACVASNPTCDACAADSTRVIRAVEGDARVAPTHNHRPNGPCEQSIGSIVGAYKSAVSKQIHIMTHSNESIWQRNYWERIIRDEQELFDTQEYIRRNPERWISKSHSSIR